MWYANKNMTFNIIHAKLIILDENNEPVKTGYEPVMAV